jgi:hypothetical protein
MSLLKSTTTSPIMIVFVLINVEMPFRAGNWLSNLMANCVRPHVISFHIHTSSFLISFFAFTIFLTLFISTVTCSPFFQIFQSFLGINQDLEESLSLQFLVLCCCLCWFIWLFKTTIWFKPPFSIADSLQCFTVHSLLDQSVAMVADTNISSALNFLSLLADEG